MSEGDSKQKSTYSIIVGTVALLVGVVGTLATIASNMKSVSEYIQSVYPDLGPFNASISTRSARFVKGPDLTNFRFDGNTSEEAVAFSVQFIEDKSGSSKLNKCNSSIILGSNTYLTDSESFSIAGGSIQQQITKNFAVRKKEYAGQAALRLACDRVIAQDVAVDLPPLPIVTAPPAILTSYIVCIGEYGGVCGSNVTHLPCGSNASEWARASHPAECRNVSEKPLSNVGGNHCGYATVQLSCSNQ